MFHTRAFVMMMAVVALWMGAFVAKSPLVAELAVGASIFLILLSLALAIWEPLPLSRAFWSGFFVLACGNLIYSGFFNNYSQTTTQVAQLLLGEQTQPVFVPAPFLSPPGSSWNTAPRSSYYAPGDATESNLSANSTPMTATFSVQLPGSVIPTYNGDYQRQREAIRVAVPLLASLLTGVLGGCVTMWIAARPKPEQPASDA